MKLLEGVLCNASYIYFADGTSGSSLYEGFIQYRHSDRAFRFGVATGVRMTLDSNGFLGIGTVSPTKELDVRDEARVWNGVNGCELSYSTGNTSAIYASANTSGNIEFRTDIGATAKMFITNSGNVGIGNTNPSAQYFNNLVIGNNDAGDKGLTIRSSSSDRGIIAFSDSDSATADRYDGFIAYEHANQALAFYTNAANERMRINSSGNVGIGTTSPDSLLTVQKNTTVGPSIALHNSEHQTWINNWGSTASSGRQSRFEINANSTDFAVGADTIRFQIGNVGDSYEKMRIHSNGNVGIGTTSPQKALEISEASTSGGAIMRLTSTGETSAGDVIGEIEFYNSDTTDYTPGVMSSIKAISGPSGGEGHLQFLTNMPSEGADASTVALHLHSNAHVGIGTTSPRTKFHIVGNDPDDDATASSAAGAFLVSNSANSYGIEMGVSSSGDGWIQSHSVTADSQYPLLLNPLGGNVGIGTTSPSSLLHVVGGDIRAENRAFFAGRRTESSPSFSFHDDSDTGMFNVASNILAFATSGSEAMRIDGSGNVFIQSGDTVTGKLQIKGGKNTVSAIGEINSEIEFASNDASVGGEIGGKISSVTEHSNGAWVGLAFYTYHQSVSDLSEKMRLSKEGLLGIGTTQPSSKCTVDDGDFETTTAGKGIILKSPDGTRYKITVANDGTVTSSAV